MRRTRDVAHALARIQTPEERAYTRYLAEVEARKRRVAELQADLESLRVTLGRFHAEYHARVGVLYVELDRVHLAIAEYERRIARLRADPDADPRTVEEEIGAEFARRREDVRAEEDETRRYRQAFEREQQRPRLDADAEAECKRLYRDLAKRFHPDLARTDDERRHRQRLMQQVNAAFRDRDQAALEALHREAEFADPAYEARAIGDKLIWAIREVARLDTLIANLEAELGVVQATETHALWRRQEAGERVIETLEQDLTTEIGTERDRLATLITTYRTLLDGRVG